MAVLIKGTELPKCCADCPLCNYHFYCKLLDRNFENGNGHGVNPWVSTFEDCPLVEVPEP